MKRKWYLFAIFVLTLILLCSTCILTSCDEDNAPGADVKTPEKLSAPTVTLNGDLASWAAVSNAVKCEISIDGNLSYIENSVTSRKLQSGQSFKIRAIGDGVNYTDSDWSNLVKYEAEKTYKITWRTEDSILEVDESVVSGTMPTYNGDTPTKAENAQYSYIFDGWTETVTPASADKTYTAKFATVVNKYTVTWKNGDEILATEQVEYGIVPVYKGTTPTKNPSPQYSYTFSGWASEIVAVTSDVTYNAQYSQSVNSYTVTWKNGDETLQQEMLEYGAIPVYKGVVPTKDSDAQYTYSFDGWTPYLSVVTGEIEYQAKFASELRSYTVTFMNESGTAELGKTTVSYGSTAAYFGSTPVKNSTNSHSFAFAGWVTSANGDIMDDLGNVVCDRTVYARFTSSVRLTSVYIVVNNAEYGRVSLSVLENIPYGTAIQINGNRITVGENIVEAIPATSGNKYSYSFARWTSDATVGHSTVITANFTREINTYTVTWMNGDKIIKTDENVKYGTVPIYNGELPAKPSDGQNSYLFSGWSPSVDAVEGDVIYYAQFTDSLNKYTVTYYDDDGVTVLGVVVVEHGQSATYPNAEPVKESTVSKTYTFNMWVVSNGSSTEAALDNIIANTNVYASYIETAQTYEVIFHDYDGTILSIQDVEYAKAAKEPEAEPFRNGYKFVGWSEDFNSIVDDIEIWAMYEKIVTVLFEDYDGSVISIQTIDYGADATLPDEPERVGYKFVGWSNTHITNIVEDMRITALYVKVHTVTFEDYDGEFLAECDVIDGEAAKEPDIDPTREGYSFVGWNVRFDNVTSNLVVTAVYEINKYKVEFLMPNGNVIATYNDVPFGTTVVAPSAPEFYVNWQNKESDKAHKFTRWSTDNFTVTGNTTITAVYDTEMNEPIIAVQSKTVDSSSGAISTSIRVSLLGNLNDIYGMSFTLKFNPIFRSYITPVDVKDDDGVRLGVDIANASFNLPTTSDGTAIDTKFNANHMYEPGKFEYNYSFIYNGDTSGFNVDGEFALITFTFEFDEYLAAGEYGIEVLDGAYVIDSKLQKTEPFVVDGVLTIID